MGPLSGSFRMLFNFPRFNARIKGGRRLVVLKEKSQCQDTMSYSAKNVEKHVGPSDGANRADSKIPV